VELKQTIELIKDRLSCEDLVGRYVPITRGKALCPFHADHRPSMQVNDRRYKCWACGAGGDQISFIQHMESVGFIEAVEMLAEQTGVKIDQPIGTTRKAWYDICREAGRRYQDTLWNSSRAVDYLLSRGVGEADIERFGLGLCVRGCLDGLDANIATQAGLLRDGREWLLNRITIPIRDWLGRTVGFAGRISPNREGPKYVNTPTTELFKKERLLYGIDTAKTIVGPAYIVEGYFDVIAMQRQGLAAVAVMGVGINEHHVQEIRRMGKQARLVMDGDRAGVAATERAVQVFLSTGLDAKIISIHGDPDEVQDWNVPAEEPCEYLAKSILKEFMIDGASIPEAGQRAATKLSQVLSTIPPRIECQVKTQLAIRQFSQTLGVPESLIRYSVPITPQATPVQHLMDTEWLSICVNHPESLLDTQYEPSEDSPYRDVIHHLQGFLDEGRVWGNLEDMTIGLPTEQRDHLWGLLSPSEDWPDRGRVFRRILEQNALRAKLGDLRSQLSRASEAEAGKIMKSIQSVMERIKHGVQEANLQHAKTAS
jgi:DNA primase catalytic core